MPCPCSLVLKIDLDERFIDTRAVAMNSSGDEFFARAAFASNQNGSIGYRHAPDDFEEFQELRIIADQALEFILLIKFFARGIRRLRRMCGG